MGRRGNVPITVHVQQESDRWEFNDFRKNEFPERLQDASQIDVTLLSMAFDSF